MLCGSDGKSKKDIVTFFMCNCIFYNKRSLRAQSDIQVFLTRFRASFFASCRASVTVEATLILPVFLYAVCSLMGLGQLLQLEGRIHFAASQTLRGCADQQAAAYYYHTPDKGDIPHNNAGGVFPEESFSRYFQEDNLCRSFVKGGRGGIRSRLIPDRDREESLTLITSYTLQIPFPLTKSFPFSRKIVLRQRIPSGYLEYTDREEEEDRIVYIARNGMVYHTSPQCSYICVRIRDQQRIRDIIRQSAWKACAHCVRKGSIPGSVYLTAGGSHYHYRLTCSSLKRTIRAVPYREVRGMRKCSRCIEREGR